MSPRAWLFSLLLAAALWTIVALVLSGCSGAPTANSALLFALVVFALLLCAGGAIYALLHGGEDDA